MHIQENTCKYWFDTEMFVLHTDMYDCNTNLIVCGMYVHALFLHIEQDKSVCIMYVCAQSTYTYNHARLLMKKGIALGHMEK